MSETACGLEDYSLDTPSPTVIDAVGRTVLDYENSVRKLGIVATDLVGNEPINTVTVTTETMSSRREDIEFHFNADRLRGTPLIPANESSRLGAVVYAIATQVEEYKDITAQDVKRNFSLFRTYLGSNLTVNSEKIPRSELFNLASAIAKLEVTLAATNEASWQALTQFSRRFSDLDPRIIRDIKQTIYAALHTKTLKQIYDEKVTLVKQKAEDKGA